VQTRGCARRSRSEQPFVVTAREPTPAHASTASRKRPSLVPGHVPKHVDTLSDRPFDYLVSLCDGVREICPRFPGDPQTFHWSIPDPAAEPGTERDTYPAFERTTVELETRIRFLLYQINDSSTAQEVTRA
jgi:protein-tyrosine-phosphatase